MSIIVIATFFPKPDTRDAVRAVISAAIPLVQAEPGCELYALQEADDRFVLVEKWASEEALTVHGQAPALATLAAEVTPLLGKDLEVVNFAAVPVGDESRGSL